MKIAKHMALGAMTAVLVGLVEAASAGAPEGASVAVGAALLGAGVLAPLGALVGLGQAVALALLGRIPLWRRARGFVSASWDRYAAGDRDGVLLLHALGIVAAALLAALLAALSVVLPPLWDLDEVELGQALVIGIALFGIIGAAIALVPLAGLLMSVLRGIERFVRIPWPRWPALRFALYVALPLGLVLVPFLLAHHEELGAAAAPPVLFLFLALEGLVWHLTRLLPLPGSVRSMAPPAALGLAVVWTLAGLFGYEPGTPVAKALDRAFIVKGGAGLERRASDFDRDGFSSLLGGGDCGAFDRARNPGAMDIPGNGIDEDCDGSDAEVIEDGARERRVAYGLLPKKQVRRYNVLWIVIDALRADHTGGLGYKRATTPYIDALAKESLLFTLARSQSSGTDMSIPSMLAGQDPSVMNWDTSKKFYGIGPGVLPLAERLDALGWHTGIFVNAWINKNVGDYGRGYDVAESLYPLKEWKTWSKRSSPLVTTRAIEFIERWQGPDKRAKEPFFLTLYYEDPHHTYERHPDKGHAQFGNRDIDRFDGEIAFADRYVGMLIEHLRHKPEVWNNTIVVVTADHGEEFKEHGGRFHNRTCYEESVRVPLVVRVPGMGPKRIKSPVALLDVVPTLLELIGQPVEGDPRLSGQSLLIPTLAPEDADPERPITCAVHSKNARDNGFTVRAVVSGDWKLVVNLRENARELYHLAKDPKEKKNLVWSEEHADELERLERLLKATLIAPKAASGASARAARADSL